MNSVVVAETKQAVVVTESRGTAVVTVASAVVVVQVNAVGPQGPGGVTGPMVLALKTIAENYTVEEGYNGLSVEDVSVAATYAVTVPSGATWVIV
jgi:hypothetical protein